MYNSPRPRSIVHKVISLSPRGKKIQRPRISAEGLQELSKNFFTGGDNNGIKACCDFDSSLTSQATGMTFPAYESNSSCNHDESFVTTESATEREDGALVVDSTISDKAKAIHDGADKTTAIVLPTSTDDNDCSCCGTAGMYRTLSQGDFLGESAEDFESVIIHFFDCSGNDSDLAFAIDKHMDKLARIHKSRHFLRMNGPLSPILTAKFGVTSWPTVLALRKGEVEARLKDLNNDNNSLSTKEIDDGKFLKEFVRALERVSRRQMNRRTSLDSFRNASYSNREFPPQCRIPCL
jgi:hypothetical protein